MSSAESRTSTSSSRLSQFGLYRTIDAKTEEFLRMSRKRQIRQGCACAAVSTAITVTIVVTVILIYENTINVDSNLNQKPQKSTWPGMFNDTTPFEIKYNKAKVNVDPTTLRLLTLILKALNYDRHLEKIIEGTNSKPNTDKRGTSEVMFQNKFIPTGRTRINANPDFKSFLLGNKNPRNNLDYYKKTRQAKEYQSRLEYFDRMISGKSNSFFPISNELKCQSETQPIVEKNTVKVMTTRTSTISPTTQFNRMNSSSTNTELSIKASNIGKLKKFDYKSLINIIDLSKQLKNITKVKKAEEISTTNKSKHVRRTEQNAFDKQYHCNCIHNFIKILKKLVSNVQELVPEIIRHQKQCYEEENKVMEPSIVLPTTSKSIFRNVSKTNKLGTNKSISYLTKQTSIPKAPFLSRQKITKRNHTKVNCNGFVKTVSITTPITESEETTTLTSFVDPDYNDFEESTIMQTTNEMEESHRQYLKLLKRKPIIREPYHWPYNLLKTKKTDTSNLNLKTLEPITLKSFELHQTPEPTKFINKYEETVTRPTINELIYQNPWISFVNKKQIEDFACDNSKLASTNTSSNFEPTEFFEQFDPNEFDYADSSKNYTKNSMVQANKSLIIITTSKIPVKQQRLATNFTRIKNTSELIDQISSTNKALTLQKGHIAGTGTEKSITTPVSEIRKNAVDYYYSKGNVDIFTTTIPPKIRNGSKEIKFKNYDQKQEKYIISTNNVTDKEIPSKLNAMPTNTTVKAEKSNLGELGRVEKQSMNISIKDLPEPNYVLTTSITVESFTTEATQWQTEDYLNEIIIGTSTQKPKTGLTSTSNKLVKNYVTEKSQQSSNILKELADYDHNSNFVMRKPTTQRVLLSKAIDPETKSNVPMPLEKLEDFEEIYNSTKISEINTTITNILKETDNQSISPLDYDELNFLLNEDIETPDENVTPSLALESFNNEVQTEQYPGVPTYMLSRPSYLEMRSNAWKYDYNDYENIEKLYSI